MYSTCSPHLAETEFVIEDVLAADKSARLLNATEVVIPGLHHEVEYRQSIGDGPYVRLWPHVHGTDGMFMAILTRD
jgi:16S rRNA (cytosine967-C5)-methyltransferase